MRSTLSFLWTGGWDSTYRLLDIIFIHKFPAQPYYMIQRERKSLRMEIVSMGKIRDAVRQRDPAAADLIAPTIFHDVRDLPECPSRAKQYSKLFHQTYLGSQYLLLAQFADHLSLNELELCVHRDDRAAYFLANKTEKVCGEFGFYYRLKNIKRTDGVRLFDNYTFPILHMTKLEMEISSKAKGFYEIMESTWFCEDPTDNDRPCGVCDVERSASLESAPGRDQPIEACPWHVCSSAYSGRNAVECPV